MLMIAFLLSCRNHFLFEKKHLGLAFEVLLFLGQVGNTTVVSLKLSLTILAGLVLFECFEHC